MIAAIVKGCNLEEGLETHEDFARQAYSERTPSDYGTSYLEAANSDEASAIFTREKKLTEMFPEAQLEFIVRGTDATGFVDYPKETEADAI